MGTIVLKGCYLSTTLEDKRTIPALPSGQLERLLAPLASERVTTILGFTEIDKTGHLYNSAAVYHKGSVIGIYRKLHPAINHFVYMAGYDLRDSLCRKDGGAGSHGIVYPNQ